MGNVNGQRHGNANRDRIGVDDFAITADDQRHFRAGARSAGRPGILNAQTHGLGFIDNAEARCAFQNHPYVALIFAARHKAMDRTGQAKCAGVCRNVVNLAVGDEERSGQTFGRDVPQCLCEVGEQSCAVTACSAALAGFNNAYFNIIKRGQPFAQGLKRGFGLLRAAIKALAFAAVDNNGSDIGETLAFLALHHRICQGQNQGRKSQGAKRRAA